ncbi:3-hydroxyisobutyrate dehydrogenase mitochondrial precursor [Gonapodya prolifera JEL478]|uniref:3-hydroxyisobutyrate dehydrogenase n=1 Tax=Gonapodya prolifera (strain JEL478) TaxID=1344416 RepID=A0A139AUR1_GONPJ|nr:3-hydroxyisobutyrate dehydrogenase mitochondrial precursor [Gonapodya prolifera JEL478]|eukprot:KXS20313.1 3-hydroxyisobutyrate dehydrogenase mitochondrial precursor [Gonapodya prolifera JEL478]
MGNPMATNLRRSLSATQSLHVHDVSRSNLVAFLQLNPTAIEQPSIADICAACDLIFVIVPGPRESYAVFGELLDHVRPGTILVDCSTVGPTVVRDNDAKRKEMLEKEPERLDGVALADAPVSGGPWGARDGSLTIMVGADSEQVYNVIEPYLNAMSNVVYNCGGIGNGQAAKICNNYCSFNNMCALAESIVLGERLGLDPATLSRIVNASSGSSYGSNMRNPVPGAVEKSPANDGYKPGFSIAMSHKDLGLAVEAGQHVDSPVRLGEKTYEYFSKAMEGEDWKGKDYSYIYELIKKQLVL